MTITELSQILGNFGEFFGAIVVVATLVYLAIQVRQNTGATKAQIYQARSDSSQQWQLVVAASEELSEIFVKISEGLRVNAAELDRLTVVERQRFLLLQGALLMRFDNMFYQYQSGLLDEEFYEHSLKPAVRTYAPIWKELGLSGWGLAERPSFANEVERILADSD